MAELLSSRKSLLLLFLLPLCSGLLATGLFASADPYEEQYANVNDSLRFPDFKSRAEGTYVFENFRDGGAEKGKYEPRWTRCSVDVTAVDRVYFMVCYFNIAGFYKAGHAQMVFEMAPGSCLADGRDVRGMVASFEAYRGKGVDYSALAGLFDKYRSIWIINSISDALEKAELVNSSVEFHELGLSLEERSALLETFLISAFQRDFLEVAPYNTIKNSCITNQFRVLGNVVDWPEGKTFPSTSVPRKAGKVMKSTGLVVDSFTLECPEELRKWREDGTLPPGQEDGSGGGSGSDSIDGGGESEGDSLSYEDIHSL